MAFGKINLNLYRMELRNKHTGLAKVAVQFSTGSFVINQILVLSINICGKNRHLRQAPNLDAYH